MLEKMESMDRRLNNIEQSMATKDDIAKLERLVNGSVEIIEQTYREVEKIGEVQLVQGETITILANHQLQTESKVAVLGKAKIV